MPPMDPRLWSDFRYQGFAPGRRASAMAGLQNSGLGMADSWLDRSIGATGLSAGAQLALDEDGYENDQPQFQGDATGISDIHPALLEMIKKSMENMEEGDAPTSEDKGLALAQAGFSMAAGDSPHALQNIGKGAMAGVSALQDLRQQRALQRMKEVQAAALMARAVQPRNVPTSDLGRLQAERAAAIKQYGEKHPIVEEYNARIGKLNAPASGGDGYAYQAQITDLMAANPGMTKQEATNTVLMADKERTNRPQQAGLYVLDDGTEVPVWADPGGKRHFYVGEGGEEIRLPFGAKATTPGSGEGLKLGDFTKMQIEFNRENQGQRALDEFVGSAKDAASGMGLLIDKWQGALKTALDSKKITPQEYAAMDMKQRQQRILGLIREQIVGPGVMTEQDAVRVINAIGGDINAFLNKETMERSIADLIRDKRENAEVLQRTLSLSAPRYGMTADDFKIYEPKFIGDKKAGSGSDGGGAGAGSGKRRIKIGADGQVIP